MAIKKRPAPKKMKGGYGRRVGGSAAGRPARKVGKRPGPPPKKTR